MSSTVVTAEGLSEPNSIATHYWWKLEISVCLTHQSTSPGDRPRSPPHWHGVCHSIKAGGGAYADPAEERLGSAELDFAEQTGREDLEPGEKSAAARAPAFQAGHLSPLRQTEVAVETLEARQANGGGRGGHLRGNCPTLLIQRNCKWWGFWGIPSLSVDCKYSVASATL